MIVPFFAFRIMVGLGLVDAGAGGGWVGCCGSRGRLFSSGWFLRDPDVERTHRLSGRAGGLDHDRSGRQPWTVYGLLRTADSVTPSLTGSDVLISLMGYTAVYLIIYPVGLWFMLQAVQARPHCHRNAGRAAAAPQRRSRRRRASGGAMSIVPVWTLILGCGGVLLCACWTVSIWASAFSTISPGRAPTARR